MTDAERITQEVADRRFNRGTVAGSTYRVELAGVPAAQLLATSEGEAIEKYNDLCGINGFAGLTHSVQLVEEYPHPLPDVME